MPEQNFELTGSGALPPFAQYLNEHPKAARALQAMFAEEQNRMQRAGETIFAQPPVELANEYDLQGIAGNWKLPENQSHMHVAIAERGALARAFETRLQSKWLFKFHDSPLDLAMKDIVLKEDARNLAPFNALLDQLIDQNPSLNAIKVDRQNTKQVYETITSIIVQFNIDDINHFTSEKRYSRDEDRAKKELDKLVQIGWNPSPPTLDKLRSAFGLDKMKGNQLFKVVADAMEGKTLAPSLPEDVANRIVKIMGSRFERH